MRREFLGIVFFLTDFLFSYIGWVLFYWVRRFYLYPSEGLPGTLWEYLWAPLIVAAYWGGVYALGGSYRDPLRQSMISELFNRVWLTILGSLALFFLAFLDDPIPNYKVYRVTLALYVGMQVFLSWFSLALMRYGLIKLLRKKLFRFPTVIVGSGPAAERTWRELKAYGHELGYDVVGYVTPVQEEENRLKGQAKYLGRVDELEGVLLRRGIHHVVVATESADDQTLQVVLAQVNGLAVEVHLLPALRDVLGGSVRVASPIEIPWVTIGPSAPSPWYEAAKRLIDVGVSIVALIVLAPLMAILALLVRLSSPGPILFRQERIGKNGRPFTIYKFRTMYVDAEKDGPALSREGDPRITPIGRWLRKTRLDELPQFWNVLKGDMSLVGPRPERAYYINQIVKKAPEYKQLLKVRPGITSLGMVKYGYASSVEEMIERMQYDLIYLANRSLLLDLKILLYTILRVLQARGK